MADAPSSTTAVAMAPGATGAGGMVPVDAGTAHRSYEAVLSALRPPTGDDRKSLGGLLRGHVQLPVPEPEEVAHRMRGEQWRTAVHLLARTRRMLRNGVGTSPQDVRDLAVRCRALRALHRHPGPLYVRPTVGGAAEGRS